MLRHKLKLGLSVALTATILSACVSKPPMAMRKAAQETTIADWEYIGGITRNTTANDLIKMFGPPSRIDTDNSYSFNPHYWDSKLDGGDRTLTCYVDKKTKMVTSLIVHGGNKDELLSETIGFFAKKKNTNDTKVRNYLGKNIDIIKRQFGEPERISSGFHTYSAPNVTVEFVAYTFQDNRVSEMWVRWKEVTVEDK